MDRVRSRSAVTLRSAIALAAVVLASACSPGSRVAAPRAPAGVLPPSLGLPDGATADTLQVGQSVQLSGALPTPDEETAAAASSASWSSSDTTITTVSPTGLVTAVAPGAAVVTAATPFDRDSVAIVVLGAPPPPPHVPISVAAPELPRTYLDTDPVPVTGRTLTVAAGGDLQAALDAAEPGDQVLLEAGATFTGNFTLRAKSGTGWITIAGTDSASLPPAGQRITPAYAAALPKIVTPNSTPAVATAPGAHHYRVVGVEVTAAPELKSAGALVALGSGTDQSTLADVPHNLVLDRVYVHGHAALSFPRCVTLNGAATAVVDSYIAECHSRTNDSQAIIGWNGPGPFKIVNNYLEGAGENVMFGGGDPSIPDVVPADVEVRRNHFFKPLAWQSEGWVVKNLFELKNARRVLVQGNVFENCWAAAQSSALVWKSVNQYGGAPWSTASDVTFQYNVVRRVNAALNLAGHPEKHPAERAARFRIAHNLFEQVGDSSLVLDEKAGRLWQVNRVLDVEIAHNTGLGTTNGLILVGESVPGGFALRDNVFGGGPGVASANDQGYGTSALEYHVPGWAMDGNVVLASAADSVPFPANNLYAATADSAGLSSDLRVIAAPAAGSVTTDGVAPGADRAAVERETAGVVLPSSDDRVVRRG
jgi:hypothetical protein